MDEIIIEVKEYKKKKNRIMMILPLIITALTPFIHKSQAMVLLGYRFQYDFGIPLNYVSVTGNLQGGEKPEFLLNLIQNGYEISVKPIELIISLVGIYIVSYIIYGLIKFFIAKKK